MFLLGEHAHNTRLSNGRSDQLKSVAKSAPEGAA
jgi:hypothetical protein